MGACNCISKKSEQAEILSDSKVLSGPNENIHDSLTVNTNVPVPGPIEEPELMSNQIMQGQIQVQALFRGYLARLNYSPVPSQISSEEVLSLPEESVKTWNFLIDFSTLPSNLPSIEARTKHLLCGNFDFGEHDPEKAFFELHEISDGNYYHGEIDEKGNPDGQGTMCFNDGTLYEGGWKSGKMNGKGRIISYLGDLFIGEFVEGKMTGQGKMEYHNGNTFEGELLDDKPHGFGKEISSEGTIYEGHYFNGLKSGKGKSIWPDGSNYEGYFLNDLYDGYGKYCWPDKEYDGEWKESKMHGKGTFKWNDGKVYSGDYVMGVKHGFGVFEWPDGKKYEGYWVDGKQEGEGTLFNKNKKRKGTWKEGKFVEKSNPDANDSKTSDNN